MIVIGAMPSWAWYTLGVLGVLALIVWVLGYVAYVVFLREEESDADDWNTVSIDEKKKGGAT
ncbi:hypothetical protein HY624_04300 [Candidatus Uhrbacteria bacterium]|nr:hypothetical protein [Candidatus Uhrbacteria bacterium]